MFYEGCLIVYCEEYPHLLMGSHSSLQPGGFSCWVSNKSFFTRLLITDMGELRSENFAEPGITMFSSLVKGESRTLSIKLFHILEALHIKFCLDNSRLRRGIRI